MMGLGATGFGCTSGLIVAGLDGDKDPSLTFSWEGLEVSALGPGGGDGEEDGDLAFFFTNVPEH